MKKMREQGCGNLWMMPHQKIPSYVWLFTIALFVSCDGGGSSGSSSNGGNSDPRHKLAFQAFSAFRDGVSDAYEIALSPDGNNLYFTARTSDRLGRFERDDSGGLTFDRYWIDGSGDVNGLDDALDLVVSPDGKHLYVTGAVNDSLAIFNLDATGDLVFSQVLLDGSGDVNGLDNAFGLTVSSDGKHLYVAGNEDHSLTFFTRDATTGALAVGAVYKDGTGEVKGLKGVLFATLSPDGKNLYATGLAGNSLAVFDRDATTGVLTFATFLRDGSSDGSGRTVDGLGGAGDLVVSPDGKNVYVTGISDNALAVFERDTATGALAFQKALRNGSAGGLENFSVPTYLTISADGKNLYVSTIGSDSLVDFDRDAATGELTFRESITASDTPAMDDPREIALSSDGKTVYLAAKNGILRFSREVR